MNRLHYRILTLSLCMALALGTFVVYSQVRNHNFIDFDDDMYVTNNPHVKAGLTLEGLKWAITTNHAWNWHPLVWLTHMLDCQLFGTNPAGHHLVNVVYHIANTLLLFLLFRRMTGDFWPSAFLAALFALHPLHVESVAWVSERKDTLSTLFWLLTMWFYTGYVERPRFTTYLPVAISLALGLMAKQMLVTLPFVLVLMDYWPLRRFDLGPTDQQRGRRRSRQAARKMSLGKCFVEKLPLIALSVIASGIILLIQSKATLVKQMPLVYRLGNAVVAYVLYAGKMFWPVRLGILYPHPGRDLPAWHVVAAVLLLLAISVTAVRFRQTYRWFIVGWLWYLGTLVPVIGLVQVGLQQVADRYTYVPLIGLFIVVSWGPSRLLSRPRYAKPLLKAVAVAVLSLLSILTWRQLSYWRNSVALYEHTIAVTSNNDILHYNLGLLMLKEGRPDQTIHHWTEAIRILPDQPTIHKRLATVLVSQGKIDRAIHHYRQALTYKPNDVQAQQALRHLLAARDKVAPTATVP
ncbi:MAG: glycosyltransferase family 39 protein [Phycisphaerales bacterium]|nr:MAG: glycosyltransferase family 39 protein [Phycisphaerales bacterium]